MKYILGGGITGLIFAYYNTDYTIITENVGGQMGSKFSLGPRYLHKTTNAKSFLDSLKIPYIERIVRVGYTDDNGWIEEPDIEFRKKYFLKSRRQKTLEGFDSFVMNSDKSQFQILNIDFPKLIDSLNKKIDDRIMKGRVTDIDIDKKSIMVRKGPYLYEFEYEYLVSTIPLNIFVKNLFSDHKLKEENYESYGMTYCLVEEDDKFDTSTFDFVYDAKESTKWHRMTKDDGNIVLDFFGQVEIIDLKDIVGSKYIAHTFLPNCQIISKKESPNIKDVKFIGRYGAWNRVYKTETVIDESIAWRERQAKNS